MNRAAKFLINLSLFVVITLFLHKISCYVYTLKFDSLPSCLSVIFDYNGLIFIPLIILNNLFYYLIYTAKGDWAKKIRANDMVYPWEENRERWNKKLPEMIGIYVSIF